MPTSTNPLRLACQAMATRFELVLYGDDPVHLRAAGEEALGEIARLETQLSFYRPESEIFLLNARAADGPVRVSPPLLRLLHHARQLSDLTDGAFDPTVAPLMRCWGFIGGTGHPPDPDDLERARALVGMNLVELNEADSIVRYLRPGVLLDLGSIGKGYAVERATSLLRENGVTQALLHGGTSTVVALGAPPDAESWSVAIQHPTRSDEQISKVMLRDSSLSVSAIHGKAFEWEGKQYGHVIDPRTGGPVEGAALASVVLPSATDTDALSTALLVLGESGFPLLAAHWPEVVALVLARETDDPSRLRLGNWNWPG